MAKITTHTGKGYITVRVVGCDYLDRHTNVYYPGVLELCVQRRNDGCWTWTVDHLSRDETHIAQCSYATETRRDALADGRRALMRAAGPMAHRNDVLRAWLAA